MRVCEGAVEVYNLAADMGGMGFIERIASSASAPSWSIRTWSRPLIGPAPDDFLLVLRLRVQHHYQQESNVRALKESDAYPAMAERGYGWEKLMSEMFCQEYWAERGVETAIARFHNVYGPYGTWDGGRKRRRGHLPQGDRGQGQRQHRDSDLGRRHPDPQLHVSSTTAQGHRHDHALRGPDRHADQSGIQRIDLDQRVGHASPRRSAE